MLGLSTGVNRLPNPLPRTNKKGVAIFLQPLFYPVGTGKKSPGAVI
jgi:hypothetical protein